MTSPPSVATGSGREGDGEEYDCFPSPSSPFFDHDAEPVTIGPVPASARRREPKPEPEAPIKKVDFTLDHTVRHAPSIMSAKSSSTINSTSYPRYPSLGAVAATEANGDTSAEHIQNGSANFTPPRPTHSPPPAPRLPSPAPSATPANFPWGAQRASNGNKSPPLVPSLDEFRTNPGAYITADARGDARFAFDLEQCDPAHRGEFVALLAQLNSEPSLDAEWDKFTAAAGEKPRPELARLRIPPVALRGHGRSVSQPVGTIRSVGYAGPSQPSAVIDFEHEKREEERARDAAELARLREQVKRHSTYNRDMNKLLESVQQELAEVKEMQKASVTPSIAPIAESSSSAHAPAPEVRQRKVSKKPSSWFASLRLRKGKKEKEPAASGESAKVVEIKAEKAETETETDTPATHIRATPMEGGVSPGDLEAALLDAARGADGFDAYWADDEVRKPNSVPVQKYDWVSAAHDEEREAAQALKEALERKKRATEARRNAERSERDDRRAEKVRNLLTVNVAPVIGATTRSLVSARTSAAPTPTTGTFDSMAAQPSGSTTPYLVPDGMRLETHTPSPGPSGNEVNTAAARGPTPLAENSRLFPVTAPVQLARDPTPPRPERSSSRQFKPLAPFPPPGDAPVGSRPPTQAFPEMEKSESAADIAQQWRRSQASGSGPSPSPLATPAELVQPPPPEPDSDTDEESRATPLYARLTARGRVSPELNHAPRQRRKSLAESIKSVGGRLRRKKSGVSIRNEAFGAGDN